LFVVPHVELTYILNEAHHSTTGLCSVLSPRQHSIGYMGHGFYRSKDPTNSIKVLKEMLQRKKQRTKTTKSHIQLQTDSRGHRGCLLYTRSTMPHTPQVACHYTDNNRTTDRHQRALVCGFNWVVICKKLIQYLAQFQSPSW